MAFGASTISDAGGAVQSLFAGFGAEAQGALQAKGLNLQADSQRINAQGDRLKAQGDLAESTEYDEAGALAKQNEAFTTQSTAIKEAQNNRQITQAVGGEQASVAGAGFANSGSSMAMLRDSASQGSLTTAVMGEQGLITEASYDEQAQSYATMSAAATTAAGGEENIATQTDQIADQTDQLATATQNAANNTATGDFITSAIKGVAALASVALAPATGGLSLAATAGLDGLGAIH
jgi:hypothetical protein